ncbi:putative Secreted Protein, partial [Cryptosporidium parvum]
MHSLKQIIILVFIIGLTLLNGIESKGYRESRINKVIKIETRSKSNAKSDSNDTCNVNTMHISNFMNTSRWRRIRNKLGTGWDDELIPPLIFCVKILDKPTNTSNSCNRNTFDLILNDGIHKSKNSVVIATVSDILKGEEKCIFVSPCEILRRIYWNDNNFTNSISNLEFNINSTFESISPNQRFISVISIKGLARSLKKAKNPWDNHLKLVQKFKNVQALSLFIPYKPHSKSFISDTCIVKPKVTSIFYGKNKPSVCKFNNCMWNIWIGQLSGEFVNERCTIGKASSKGDYIVGWFSPFAIDSETLGSVKLKMQWNSPEDPN